MGSNSSSSRTRPSSSGSGKAEPKKTSKTVTHTEFGRFAPDPPSTQRSEPLPKKRTVSNKVVPKPLPASKKVSFSSDTLPGPNSAAQRLPSSISESKPPKKKADPPADPPQLCVELTPYINKDGKKEQKMYASPFEGSRILLDTKRMSALLDKKYPKVDGAKVWTLKMQLNHYHLTIPLRAAPLTYEEVRSCWS